MLHSTSKGEVKTNYYTNSHTLEVAQPQLMVVVSWCLSVLVQYAHPLVQTLWWRHRTLDGEAAHVLPSLLQQRDEVVDGQHDVANQLILGHVHVAHGHTHAQHLLQLELDRRLDFGDLVVQVFGVGDGGWELAGC